MTSIAAGAIIGLLSRDRRKRLALLVGYAIVAGLLVTAAIQGLLGGLTGSWLSNELVVTLAAGSIAAVTCGFASWAGIAGILCALVVAWFFGFGSPARPLRGSSCLHRGAGSPSTFPSGPPMRA